MPKFVSYIVLDKKKKKGSNNRIYVIFLLCHTGDCVATIDASTVSNSYSLLLGNICLLIPAHNVWATL